MHLCAGTGRSGDRADRHPLLDAAVGLPGSRAIREVGSHFFHEPLGGQPFSVHEPLLFNCSIVFNQADF